MLPGPFSCPAPLPRRPEAEGRSVLATFPTENEARIKEVISLKDQDHPLCSPGAASLPQTHDEDSVDFVSQPSAHQHHHLLWPQVHPKVEELHGPLLLLSLVPSPRPAF